MDVKAWLRTLPYGALDQWLAFDAIEPIGDEWEQSAQVALSVYRLSGIQLAKAGAKPPEISFDDCMPARYRPPKVPKAKKAKQLDSGFNQLKAALGFGSK